MVKDANVLATMNERLIRDEGHRNAMTRGQLKDRMGSWLQTDYSAVIFESNARVAGYALYRTEADHTYLRQFFVEPAFRRRGIGCEALSWLRSNVWADSTRLRIDVLVGNVEAIAFWRAVGFHDYCITMESEVSKMRKQEPP